MISPPLDEQAAAEAARNHNQTAKMGRDPAFRLLREGREVSLQSWAAEIVQDVRQVAELIDRDEGGSSYLEAVDAQSALIDNPDATPSARILDELQRADTGFFDFALECARGHKEYFKELAPLSGDRLALYANEVDDSIKRQHDIEASDEISFDEYLQQYYSEQGCCK